ncbi:phosphohydrolase [Clostridium carboxidivorans P7]|uniref:Metal dependent phosphohydrolase n=1 Tax=Clostridium carboxidivorans P7 TaxID=536227 RepID=C6PYK4_9CLOT|nr:HD-GYP domain-containing protein [Clostridium carboxidivorans]AKN29669.1 phosphohydrolase [Clostridium carboxidivorans P7]EET85684.1 metal dependent phosphohydrolase [Clostridium carboxidivorans P7]EFG89399.1 HD domain protein [Clostridium carboxidivorans P7]
MGKKCVLVSECKIGDIIAQKIVSKYGATIAVENTVINNYIIKKLATFETKYIWIYSIDKDELPKIDKTSFSDVKKNYKTNIIEINQVVNDLCKGKKVEVNKIDKISNSIYKNINDEYYIVKCLSELRDSEEYVYTHSVNVSFYGMLLSKWLCLTKKDINQIVVAGLLHDIGNVKVPIEILNKKGKVDVEEFDEIKKHPIYGYNMVKDTSIVSDVVKEVILMHHERMNSTGYPLGKDGDELSIYCKIIAVVDAYDAITSDRTYRKRRTPFEAFEILKNNSMEYFDIHVMDTFLENIAACYVGSKVLLTNDEEGEILYVPPHCITNPVVSIGERYIDLSKESDIKVKAML